MTWVKSDDGMSIHRKVSPLSDAAYRLMNEAREWCSRNLTNGVISVDEFPTCSCRATDKNAADLVRRGIWHRAGDDRCSHDPEKECSPPGPDGWIIHDYLVYNPSRDEVLADRKAKAERQRRYMEKLRAKRRNTDASTPPSADTSLDAPHDASQPPSYDAPDDASLTLAPSPSPSPPRREAGDGVPRESPPPAADGGRAPSGDERKDQNLAADRPVPSEFAGARLADARAMIADARRKAHRAGADPDPGSNGHAPTALDRLRELTPDAPDELVAEPGTDAAGADAPPLDRVGPTSAPPLDRTAGSVPPGPDRNAA